MPSARARPKTITVSPSPRKLAALRQLSRPGIALSDGYDYHLHDKISPGLTLEQVRKALAVIQEPLARSIIEEREHE